MPIGFEFDNPILRTWLLLHQTYDLVVRAEDVVFGKVNLTSQQHAVLLAIKYIEGPATPSVIAQWINRYTSTTTALLDRMEKDGLVERVRDLNDRRAIRVVMTEKSKQIIDKGTMAGWELAEHVVGGLSEKEQRELVRMLEIMRDRTFQYLNPDQVLEKIKPKDEAGCMARFLVKRASCASDHATETEQPG